MKLSETVIESIVFGKLYTEKTKSGLVFHRTFDGTTDGFTRQKVDFGRKCNATPCVVFDFYTDSKKIELSVGEFTYGSSRSFFAFDVLVNDSLFATFRGDRNSDENKIIEVGLDGNLNRVSIYSPWSIGYTLQSFEVDDGAKIIPILKDKRFLFLGDSITHGYDCQYPSQMYANKVARFFNAEVINQAIGGADANEIQIVGGENPDYIIVAYGTNDWCHYESFDEYVKKYNAFVEKLVLTYSDIPIILLSPIYRLDTQETKVGKFDVCKKIISDSAKKYGCIFIDATDFVGRLTEFFSPDKVHPIDSGNSWYSENMIQALREYIK